MKKLPVLPVAVLLCLILLLAGCVQTVNNAETLEPDSQDATTIPEPTELEVSLPEQQEMSQAELDQVVAEIDMSVLCAGFDVNQRIEKLKNPHLVMQTQVVRADYDQDGLTDVLLGRRHHAFFSLFPQRKVSYISDYANPDYYSDKSGNLYSRVGTSDGFDIEIDGAPAWVEYVNYAYKRWQNGDWQTVFSCEGDTTFVTVVDADGQERVQERENRFVCWIDGKEVSKAELDSHLASIGMEEIDSRPADYIRCEYDACYHDSILEALDSYFAQHYRAYTQMLCCDLDADGVEEAIFVLPDFEEVWYNSLQPYGDFCELQDAQRWFDREFSNPNGYTGVVIAQVEGNKLNITAYCALEYISAYDGMDIHMENGYLWLDNSQIYLNGYYADVQENIIAADLSHYITRYGYGNCFIRLVDVTDIEGKEYLCVCCKDGVWYVFVFAIINGDPVIVYNQSLENRGLYLTEYQGKQALLTYYQTMFTQNGETMNHYNYSVLRVSDSANTQTLDSAYVNYTDADQDATKIAAFFQKLNAYLIKFSVIYDPYTLTGKLWMDPSEAACGTVPEDEPQADISQQEPIIGFVQIQDPSSWLHLRVGPGVEYDKVLIDPADPNSFVRQALGAPVTVLETIQTDDAVNPVWLKIRITYAGYEIIGYSSKNYIRLANE